MTRWLENFAFRIPLRFWILIAGASIIMLIAALTVSLQTWKAATKNPVDSLKYE
jgi:putative ABC transport system permease protein